MNPNETPFPPPRPLSLRPLPFPFTPPLPFPFPLQLVRPRPPPPTLRYLHNHYNVHLLCDGCDIDGSDVITEISEDDMLIVQNHEIPTVPPYNTFIYNHFALLTEPPLPSRIQEELDTLGKIMKSTITYTCTITTSVKDMMVGMTTPDTSEIMYRRTNFSSISKTDFLNIELFIFINKYILMGMKGYLPNGAIQLKIQLKMMMMMMMMMMREGMMREGMLRKREGLEREGMMMRKDDDDDDEEDDEEEDDEGGDGEGGDDDEDDDEEDEEEDDEGGDGEGGDGEGGRG